MSTAYTDDVLSIACSRCSAAAGERCHTKAGTWSPAHAARVAEADAMIEAYQLEERLEMDEDEADLLTFDDPEPQPTTKVDVETHPRRAHAECSHPSTKVARAKCRRQQRIAA